MKSFKFPLFLQIIIALIAGVLFGIYATDYTKYTDWAGTLFLNALKMVVIPLVACSVISGITNINVSKSLKKLGFATFGYYLLTSLLAILTGLFVSNIAFGKPEKVGEFIATESDKISTAQSSSIYDSVMNIIPQNVFKSVAEGEMLPIIFFCIVFALFTLKTGGKAKQVINDFATSCFEILLKLTLFIIKLTPIGVFAIVATKVALEIQEGGDLLEMLLLIKDYIIAVVIALFLHSFITLPILTALIAKRNPIEYMWKMLTPLLTAFSTSSSSATLPFTMETATDKAKVDKRITGFTMPLGATINMDGTALYECVAVMFIAHYLGVDLDMGAQITIVLTALLVSIGAAGIPMAGLFMMTVILEAVNLPIEAIAIIMAIDRPLDMLRTATNVWSDSCGAACVERVVKLPPIAESEGESLK